MLLPERLHLAADLPHGYTEMVELALEVAPLRLGARGRPQSPRPIIDVRGGFLGVEGCHVFDTLHGCHVLTSADQTPCAHWSARLGDPDIDNIATDRAIIAEQRSHARGGESP